MYPEEDNPIYSRRTKCHHYVPRRRKPNLFKKNQMSLICTQKKITQTIQEEPNVINMYPEEDNPIYSRRTKCH